MWPLVSGFFHLVQCFQGSSVLTCDVFYLYLPCVCPSPLVHLRLVNHWSPAPTTEQASVFIGGLNGQIEAGQV
jgi:hypothetical protein